MRYYDFGLAKKIIDKFVSLVDVAEVSLGMHEDWFWTAEDVWKDGRFTKELNSDTQIGGINGSRWATPVIVVELKNGESHTFNCYKVDGEEPDILTTIEMSLAANGGCMSGPVNEMRMNIEVKDFKE